MAASAADAIKAALTRVGAPYAWGATGPDSFDCSGLLVWAWKKAGVTLPRTSQAMAKFGTPVAPKDLKPGDLITSDWGSGPSSHVAMYIGDNKVIHAPRPGRTVTVANLDANYRSKVNAIRRIPGVSYAGLDPAGFKVPDVGGWAKDLLGGAEDFGKGLLDGLGSDLTAPFKLMGEQLATIGGAMLSVGAFAEWLLKLALPSTWVRIACAGLGVSVLFLGLFFLVREARGGA